MDIIANLILFLELVARSRGASRAELARGLGVGDRQVARYKDALEREGFELYTELAADGSHRYLLVGTPPELKYVVPSGRRAARGRWPGRDAIETGHTRSIRRYLRTITALAGFGGITRADLAPRLGVSDRTLSRYLEQLQAQGFEIERRRLGADVVRLRLSAVPDELGRALLEHPPHPLSPAAGDDPDGPDGPDGRDHAPV